MRDRIIEILHSIEAEKGVRVLYACESGSRAWGFSSPDSDYDVRFVYVRPLDDYLKLAPERDVIEREYPEWDIDLAGWDLKKALPLFAKSNPSFYEWLNSPIAYIVDEDFRKEVREMEEACFNPKASFHHYYGTAVSHDLRYLERNGITLKRFLYYFRSLLCCGWVLERKTPPPVRFDVLFREMLPTEPLREKTRELLRLKSESKENDTSEVDEVLIDYANGLRDILECVKDVITCRAEETDERLEMLFKETVLRFS